MKEIISYLQELKKRWRTITIVTLVFILFSLILSSFFMDREYEASVKVFLGKQNFKNTSQEYNNEEVQLYQRLITTYSEIIKTHKLINNSINQSKINSNKTSDIVDYNRVIGSLIVTPITGTQIIELKYKDDDGQDAYDLLYAITENIIAYSKELYPTVNIKILQQVDITSSNLATKKTMIIIIGLFLGLIISCGYIILKIYISNTFNKKEDLEKLNVAVLGVIPDVEGLN